MNLALLQKGSSGSEFPHWSETLATLKYFNKDNDDIRFCHYKRIPEDELYVDPLGIKHECFTRKDFDHDNTPLVVNGSIHLETTPLSKGKIPYNSFKYKVAINHTSGYSPWDYLQMVDLAHISESDKIGTYSAGCHLAYIMPKKFYDRFMSTDWTTTQYPNYESYKQRIHYLKSVGHIVVGEYEPTQFWLHNVPRTYNIKLDTICVALNWSNFKTMRSVNKIISRLIDLYNSTGLNIDLKLHSYCKESFLKEFNKYDFINVLKYDEVSKYNIMDHYNYYVVDGTGLGYETSYRNKLFGREVNIYYFNGLESETNEFAGVVELGAIPTHTIDDVIANGLISSNYPSDIIDESFPHDNEVESVLTTRSFIKCAYDNLKLIYEE